MDQHRLAKTLTLLIAVSTFVAGCGNEISRLKDDELRDRIHGCNASELSPGMAIACDNYRRECNRRREKGHFVC